ncbi:MAG: hypothetical protein WDZ73_01420 [Candidatus Paceibacterota bacterium]
MNYQTLTTANTDKKVIAFLLVLIVASAIFYVYFINSSIFNVIARKEAEEMVTITETEISGLVSEYMRLSQAINLNLAQELSFVAIPTGSVVAVETSGYSAVTTLR